MAHRLKLYGELHLTEEEKKMRDLQKLKKKADLQKLKNMAGLPNVGTEQSLDYDISSMKEEMRKHPEDYTKSFIISYTLPKDPCKADLKEAINILVSYIGNHKIETLRHMNDLSMILTMKDVTFKNDLLYRVHTFRITKYYNRDIHYTNEHYTLTFSFLPGLPFRCQVKLGLYAISYPAIVKYLDSLKREVTYLSPPLQNVSHVLDSIGSFVMGNVCFVGETNDLEMFRGTMISHKFKEFYNVDYEPRITLLGVASLSETFHSWNDCARGTERNEYIYSENPRIRCNISGWTGFY